MDTQETLLEFPCEFPLKVMGLNTKEFIDVVREVVSRRLIGGARPAFSSRISSTGKYVSVTATFVAQSLDQLNSIYGDLKKHPLVLTSL